jgi:hypothetical protein
MATSCLAYTPSDVDEQRFWDQQRTRNSPPVDVPPGFPKKLESPLAWTGADIEAKQSQWKLDLTGEELLAIDSALATFEGMYCWVARRHLIL